MVRKLLLLLLRGYQLCFSAFWPACCRFTPTCSHYAQEAITQHGVFYGGILTVKRVLRCHPWGQHGYDPVPCSRKPDQQDKAYD